MAEYIEREALLEDIENTLVFSGRPDHQNQKQMGARMVVQRIRCAPAADVAPVVRCKDCLYWQSGENECDKWEYCTIHNIGIGPHSFCSYGERKDGDGNDND